MNKHYQTDKTNSLTLSLI